MSTFFDKALAEMPPILFPVTVSLEGASSDTQIWMDSQGFNNRPGQSTESLSRSAVASWILGDMLKAAPLEKQARRQPDYDASRINDIAREWAVTLVGLEATDFARRSLAFCINTVKQEPLYLQAQSISIAGRIALLEDKLKHKPPPNRSSARSYLQWANNAWKEHLSQGNQLTEKDDAAFNFNRILLSSCLVTTADIEGTDAITNISRYL
jgi:hypothetical protein